MRNWGITKEKVQKVNTREKNTITISLNWLVLLFIVFMVLKLTGTIDWSWWWVTAPLWAFPAVGLGVFVVFGLLFILSIALDAFKKY